MLLCCQMATYKGDFGMWLEEELTSRGLKQADLARMSKLNKGVISRLVNMEREPHYKTLKAVANALDIPQKEVFIRAGFLDPEPDYDPTSARTYHKLSGLPPEKKLEAERYVEFLSKEKPEPTIHAGSSVKK